MPKLITLFAICSLVLACGGNPMDVAGRTFTSHVTVTKIHDPCGGEPGKKPDGKFVYHPDNTLTVEQTGETFDKGSWKQDGEKVTLNWTATVPVTSNGQQVGSSPVTYAADLKMISERSFTGTGTLTALWCVSDLQITWESAQ